MSDNAKVSEESPTLQLLNKDLKKAMESMTDNQARFLVDTYYQLQANRMRDAGQIRAIQETGEPHEVLDWLMANNMTLEGQLRLALKKFAESRPMGRWAMGHKGIGPVLASGLMAHIDIRKAQTVGAIWRYGGYDPTSKWEKGKKRPWNAKLKVLLWKIGESFVKVKGLKDAHYGHWYEKRKLIEIERNDQGGNADTAMRLLTEKKFDKTTVAYAHLSKGKLPPAQIHARARRWAVKLFLAHWFEEAYRLHHGKPAPLPYAIGILDHAHYIGAPPPGKSYTQDDEGEQAIEGMEADDDMSDDDLNLAP